MFYLLFIVAIPLVLEANGQGCQRPSLSKSSRLSIWPQRDGSHARWQVILAYKANRLTGSDGEMRIVVTTKKSLFLISV